MARFLPILAQMSVFSAVSLCSDSVFSGFPSQTILRGQMGPWTNQSGGRHLLNKSRNAANPLRKLADPSLVPGRCRSASIQG